VDAAPPPVRLTVRVLLACSAGGHLRQLYVLKDWWGRHDRHWVTFDTEDAIALLAGEQITWAHHPTTRNIPNLIRNFVRTFGLVRRYRPDVIVSTGAAIAVPLFVWARVFGIRTVFIEVYDRIEKPTLTSRLVRPMTDLFLVQWEEQRRLHKGSVLAGQLL
jgi:UDP-N-acetylglucosamine:LPS N-acetylglucosamine transferase